MTDGDGRDGGAGALLHESAAHGLTGSLVVHGPEGLTAQVWMREGLVYAVNVPGKRPMLGVRLMSAGIIGPDQLAEALEVQRSQLPGWRVGELLVHFGFVDRSVVDDFVLEQIRDQIADLLEWRVVGWEEIPGAETREDVAPPVELAELLAAAHHREESWAQVVAAFGGATAVPRLSGGSTFDADVVLGPHDWALLCKVDGRRTLAQLAEECGFTVHEAGQMLQALCDSGLVEVDRAEQPPEPDTPAPTTPEPPLPPPAAPPVEPEPPSVPEPPPPPPPPPVQPEPPLAAPTVPVPDEAPAPEAPTPRPWAPAAAYDPDLAHEASTLLTAMVQDVALTDPPPAEEKAAATSAVPAGSDDEQAGEAADAPAPPRPPLPPAETLDPADAAALLRELSSLSDADEQTPPTRPEQPRPASPQPEHKRKKKRGFFGH